MSTIETVINFIKDFSIADFLDIVFICFLSYAILKFVRDTRAAQFIKGILLIVVLQQVTGWLKMDATYQLITEVVEYGILVIAIIFQPELRSMLERVGRKGFTKITAFGSSEDRRNREAKTLELISYIAEATKNLAVTKTGALMVVERDTRLGEIINTGTVINADPSVALIMSIFYPKSTLHDGAIIFRDNRIYSAGCFLPLSNSDMEAELGTRHHAAMGVSEISDAVVIVVSEETGIISIVVDGKMKRRITPDGVTTRLRKYLITAEDKKKEIFSSLRKNKPEQEIVQE